MKIKLLVAAASMMIPYAAFSQGFATWLGDRVGLGNAGRALDRAHDQVKQAVPGYRAAEQAIVSPVRHLTTEATVETVGPVLKNLILLSRDDALNAGAQPLPSEIIWEFDGFYSPDVLNSRWRSGQGHELSLQANAFRFGDRAAIALDTVIVFRNHWDAYSLWLWAHELAHIEQYRRWGVDDFAKRYIRDSDGIEREADARANEFMIWRQRRLVPNAMPTDQRVAHSVQISGLSSICEFTNGPRAGQRQDYAPLAGVPIGMACQDGMGSFGSVVGPDGGGGRSMMRLSTLCQFYSGPRAGQIQDYAPMQGIPGAPCWDGWGSFGQVTDPGQGFSPASSSNLSTLCQFTYGPRAGQIHDYVGWAPVPVGTPCNDGIASIGVVIPR